MKYAQRYSGYCIHRYFECLFAIAPLSLCGPVSMTLYMAVVGWTKDTKCEWKSIWIQTFAGISSILVLYKSTKHFLVNSYNMQDLYTEWINS